MAERTESAEWHSLHLTKPGVAVEKGTKAVISMNFSVYGKTNIQ
jgi:hypothetical protein